MTISLAESLLVLSLAAREVPGSSGNGVHNSTVWRWALRGIRGIRLETVVIGGVRYTSREALDRFIRATTAAADGLVSHAPTCSQRDQAIRVAEHEFDAQGGKTLPRREKKRAKATTDDENSGNDGPLAARKNTRRGEYVSRRLNNVTRNQ
jgi:hypothetical protein